MTTSATPPTPKLSPHKQVRYINSVAWDAPRTHGKLGKGGSCEDKCITVNLLTFGHLYSVTARLRHATV
jgi:hypothetical protein